jgi:hypothetical protein
MSQGDGVMESDLVPLGIARAVAAWVAATLIGALVFVISLDAHSFFRWSVDPAHAFDAALFTIWIVAIVWMGGAIVAAPLALFAVVSVRAVMAPRPWADMVGSATIAALLPDIVNTIVGFADESQLIDTLPYSLPTGLVAGVCYWFFTGRPRPPYVSDTNNS